jgi:hypothetical protein
MAKTRTCKLCGLRPARVPDRERVPPKPTPEVCGECHAARLCGDLERVLAAARPRPDGEAPC